MNDPVTRGGEEREEAPQILSQQDIASRIDGFLANAPHSLDFDFEKRLSAVNDRECSSDDVPLQHEMPIPDMVDDMATNLPQNDDPAGHKTNTTATTQLHDYRIELPNYVQPLSDDLDAEDLKILQGKGVFSVPHKDLLDELLLHHILYVHPFLPLLDLEEFHETIKTGGSSNKISLLLLQAVLFSAVPFVNLHLLEAEGYENREKARRKCFEKVRLLFDFNVEPDPITLIQSTLLMTTWYDMPEDIKGRSHWLRISLSYAYDIGLNRSAQLVGCSPKQQQTRKRLWWCCYTRDKITCLNERRLSSIRDEDANIPLLEVQDFETNYLSNQLKQHQLAEPTLQVEILSELFIQKIQLCILFGRVLNTLYVPRGHRREQKAEIRIVLVPKISESVAGEIITLDQELCKWAGECRLRLEPMIGSDLANKSIVVDVHHALLGLLYQTMHSMVHRLHQCQIYSEGSQAQTLQRHSHQILRGSAQGCTDLAKRLTNEGRIKYLAPIGITTLLFAGVQHIADLHSSELAVRAAAEHCLDQTMQSLYRLREVYESARHAIGLLRIVHRSKTSGPFPEDRPGQASQPQAPVDPRRAQASIFEQLYPNNKDNNIMIQDQMRSERPPMNSTGSPSITGTRNYIPSYWESGPEPESILGLHDPAQDWFSDFSEFACIS